MKKNNLEELSPLVGIVIPAFNASKYIDACISSVLNQTYLNLQVVLVDDGSTDSTGLICDEWAERDPRIEVVHKENGGISSARNAGFRKICSDWIWFVDSDDLIDPDSVRLLLEKGVATNADVVSMNHCCIDEAGGFLDNGHAVQDEYPGELCRTDGYGLRRLLFENRLGNYAWSYFIRSSFLKHCRPSAPFTEKVRILEDVDFAHHVMCMAATVSFVGTPLYQYRMVPGSLMHTVDSAKAVNGLNAISFLMDMDVPESLTTLKYQAYCSLLISLSALVDRRNDELNAYGLIRDEVLAIRNRCPFRSFDLPVCLKAELLVTGLINPIRRIRTLFAK